MKKNHLLYFLRLMKYSFKIILLQCLTLSVLWAADLPAQSAKSVKEVKINLNLQDVTVIQALKVIESKTEFRFTYDGLFLENDTREINVKGRKQMVYTYLKEIAAQAGLNFRQYNNSISVKKAIQQLEEPEEIEVIIQTRIVNGRVIAADTGEGLPGVNVVEKGTNNGTVTDIQGDYTLEVSEGATLTFSSVGYVTETIPVSNRSTIDLTMRTDITQLEELVVIGYGTQQSRDLTSAISRVQAQDIEKTPTSNPMQALQGRVAGVQIVSNGAPGASPTVRVRGIGSFESGANPLYVVDGMFFDNIDFLNPNDIENISVLKDASAAAIYGVRAANGVVLVETKSGSYNQEMQLVYDGYYGVQNPQNVIKMANTEQFAQYVRETGDQADISFLQNAFQRYGRSRVNPNVPAVNTDWYATVMSPAPIQNHSVNAYGGGENSKYSIGASFFSQEGLLNEYTRDEYKRFNLRTKLSFRVKDWLTVGGNLNIGTSRQYVGESGAWFQSYFAVPIIPPFDDTNDEAFPFELGNAQLLGYRSTQNPMFPLLYSNNRNDVGKLLGNFFGEIDIIPNQLYFKSSYNYSIQGRSSRNINFYYDDGIAVPNPPTSFRREAYSSFDQVWDSYLTYENTFGDNNITLVGGYSFRSEFFEVFGLTATDTAQVLDLNEEHLWYLDRFDNINRESVSDVNVGGNDVINSRLFYQSFFGRVAYDYDSRYLIYSTYRIDGNNKFQEKWGSFFTLGSGWILSEEDFFNVGFIDFLKLKASWGQLGNDDIRPAVGGVTFNRGRLTVLNGAPGTGLVVDPTFDLIDRWETTEEWNFGLTTNLFNNRLNAEANYFIRDSENVAITIILPLFRENIRRSVGAIRNSGFEFDLTWTDNVTENFAYTIGGNFSTLHNEVLDLGGAQGLNAGQAEFRQRSIIGQPFQAFYGYEINGVFQTQEQINNSGYNDEFIDENNLSPGDFWFVDQNDDGVIDDQDRTVIGSYLPDFTYGFNFNIDYGNFSLAALFQGQVGHDILNRKRGEIIFTNDTNLDAELINNLWRGEGTSNRYPSAQGLRKGWNQNMSEYFVEDGSYFRIQNVRLSYNLVDQGFLGISVPDTRIYVTAERPLTVFDYNGFNPEVANGIDRQVYPIPAIYTIGLNVKL